MSDVGLDQSGRRGNENHLYCLKALSPSILIDGDRAPIGKMKEIGDRIGVTSHRDYVFSRYSDLPLGRRLHEDSIKN